MHGLTKIPVVGITRPQRSSGDKCPMGVCFNHTARYANRPLSSANLAGGNQQEKQMGEYAEYQLSVEMRRGRPASNHDGRKSPIGGHCPFCKKPIRTIAGRIKDSMAAHIKAKHGKTAAMEYIASN